MLHLACRQRIYKCFSFKVYVGKFNLAENRVLIENPRNKKSWKTFSRLRRQKSPLLVVACSVEHRVCVRLPATPVILVRFTFICMNAGKQVLILMQF